MRRAPIILITLFAALSAEGATEVWWKWLCPELRKTEQRRAAAMEELRALGVPMFGETAAERGYQHNRMPSQPLTASWVQMDLRERRAIDSIALVPALVNWQSQDQSAFAFPIRFRVDLSDHPEFKEFDSVGAFTERDFPNPGIAPVTIHAGGRRARYVRLTVTKLAEEDGKYFFALSELMVISGNLNIAIGCPVTASGSVEMAPRWAVTNLVDGRTPLGPPIRRELLQWDGVFAGPVEGVPQPWMQLDLGKSFHLDQVRIHPIHSRIGSDAPGFFFPRHLKVTASLEPEFVEPLVLFDSGDYSNPGNNPMTIWANSCEARYVRITAVKCDSREENRFGLSEVEVYSGGTNVAHQCKVTRIDDPEGKHWSWNWPLSLLVDGFTSYGRLMELPVWLENWERRRELQAEIALVDKQDAGLVVQAQRRAVWLGLGIAATAVLAAAGLMLLSRHRRQRELDDLRMRLTRDIHDDIGSNLAGIAVLSEVAGETVTAGAQCEDWHEVNRITRETLVAMREVLWLAGSRAEAGVDLMTHMQVAASRMLAGKEVHWKSTVAQLPPELGLEERRQIFLFFKEALSNIVQHARATRVELAVQLAQRRLLLSIVDNGCGFDLKDARRGIGRNSQQMRVRALRGTCKIDSEPGRGTGMYLEVPLGKPRRRWGFVGKAANTKR
jgi:signal transduction histidine kinase